MSLLSDNQQLFVHWVKEREAVRLRRAVGQPAPWTDDPAIADWCYCNIDREDDAVTRWIRQNWTYPYTPDGIWSADYYTLAMMVARVFNLPATLEVLGQPVESVLWLEHAEEELWKKKKRGERIWNGAYIVSTNGKRMPKITRYSKVLGEAAEHLENIDAQQTLAEAHEAIKQVEGFSNFLAAQVVADLKNTPNHPLRLAEDWWTFSAPGPGSLRGLGWFWETKVTARNYYEAIERSWGEVKEEFPVEIVRKLCRQNLQNCFCEFDKYMRVRTGGRAKRRFRDEN